MRLRYLGFVLLAAALVVTACSPEATPWLPTPTSEPAPASEAQVVPVSESGAASEPDVRYTLLTGAGTGKLVFVGQGGEIDGMENPVLTADPGDSVEITLVNADNILHDFVIDEFNVHSEQIQDLDSKVTLTFEVGEAGEYDYYCSLPGHRQAGMEGVLRVGEPAAPVAAVAPSIVRNPADLPGPIGDRLPTTVKVDLLAQEVEGQLADGTTFTYYTFNGQVPGPMIRVRVGDTIELKLTNDTSSTLSHSIDLHAVNGPGGGAVYTQTAPGETHAFSFKTLSPGVFVYHCATPSVAHHIAMGMYSLIVVEPEGGLPPVDKEFYVMQGEIYT
ncbi:MAG: multicopper oxidase domain-containing protein, partial [Anaerolineales bacterium]